jgi:hypothetical protein
MTKMKRRFISDFEGLSGRFTAGTEVSFFPLAGSSGGITFANRLEEIWPAQALLGLEGASVSGEHGPVSDLSGPEREGSFTDQIADSGQTSLSLDHTGSGAAETAFSAPMPGHGSALPSANLMAELVEARDAAAGVSHGNVAEVAPLADSLEYHLGLHIAVPADGDAAVVAAISGGLVATPSVGSVSAGPASLALISPGAYSAAAAVTYGGATEIFLDHPISDNGSAASSPAGSPAVLASLENAAAGSPIANAGVSAGGATAAQVKQALDESGLSVNGAGIKVGVLSDSFNDLGSAAADEADGALPFASNIDVIKDLASGGTDEGRAMMQIIHDIAPSASLAFYTAFDSEQDFANGILALAAAGSKVIVDDVSYYDEPFFQNGVVAQAIQTVEAEGVTYVTAAGNEGSNGYQAAWTPISGVFDGIPLVDAESFGGSLVQTVTINTEGTGDDVPLLLEWNQAYGAATSNLEILVFHNGSLVGTATNRTNGEPTNPWVGFDFAASGTYQVAIMNLSSTNPGLIKEITEGDGLPATISGANSGTVVGHAMTPGAISAGAVSAADTPAFGFSSPHSENFSSSGAGTELLFANNGMALSSPDLLSPVAVSGVDDIATTVPGGSAIFTTPRHRRRAWPALPRLFCRRIRV